jgi:tRNA pseudouridine13 synthase
MKLKRLPADFQVEELVELAPRGGPFALYRLTKQSLGTPEAIDAVLAQWKLSRGQVAYAGLKDRHAQTTQWVTIKGGPRRGLRQENLALEYVGQAGRPIQARDITANRFAVVIRDLVDGELAVATAALDSIAASGLPNYFDDQRFGSLGESGEFIARPWCLGDYERALWLALAEPNVHDRPDEREQKRILRDCWGDWPRCKSLLARSHRRSIITYLADKPGDFRRAIGLVRQDLRSIWLAAFQSHLWNQIAARMITLVCRQEQLVTQAIGRRELPFFLHLDEAQRQELATVVLPLPSARLHLSDQGSGVNGDGGKPRAN